MCRITVFFFSVLLILLSSCEKDIGSLGMGVMPSSDIIEVREDSLQKFNFKYIEDNTNDTIRTDQFYLLLGSYSDPVFGKVRAEIFAPFYFNNPVFDRNSYSFEIYDAHISITYTDTSFVYGKSINQKIDVYQMLDSIDIDDYKTLNFSCKEKYLTSFTLNVDTTIESDSTVTFALPSSFISTIDQYLKTGIYAMDIGPDSINKDFGKKFFGLHFRTNFDDAGIVKLSDLSIKMNIKIWNGETTDTVTQEMICSDFVDKESYIYKHPLVRFDLKHPVSLKQKIGMSSRDTVFIQSMKGFKSEFYLSDIQRWLDTTKTVINIARFTVPIVKDDSYPAIPSLLLNIYQSGNPVPIQSITSKDIGTGSEYVFYVNSFMKQFLSDKLNADRYRYEIVVPNNNLEVGRSVLLAGKAKLKLTYTKYK